MPPTAGTVLPHAKSVNNITLSALLREFALCSSAAPSVDKFLCTAIAGIPPKAATTMADSLGIRATRSDKLSASQVAALCQVLRDDPHVRPPSAQCLSPAGEYNLRLGVLKELKPRLVATYTDKPGVHEGHSFLVEAAVSLGGSNIREGINIFRFANRIPLLFEPGADVVTQVNRPHELNDLSDLWTTLCAGRHASHKVVFLLDGPQAGQHRGVCEHRVDPHPLQRNLQGVHR